jgi:uncharacterized protein YjbI with pentapeptide repeats
MDAVLVRAILTDAKSTHAELIRTDLTGATLTGAKFTHATLTDANFTHCILVNADFSHANVTDAYFDDHDELAKNAILTGVHLEHVRFGGLFTR